jgi:hypothetical protein
MLMCPDSARAHEKAEKKRAALAKKQRAIHEWSVQWFFHGEPPDGLPRVLAIEHISAYAKDGARRGELAALYKRTLHKVPPGYILGWQKITTPPKRKTAEQRGKMRRTMMEKRAREQYPLFADEIIERELRERPAYYAGEKDTAFRDQIDAEETALFERLEHGTLGMQIYHPWFESGPSAGWEE